MEEISIQQHFVIGLKHSWQFILLNQTELHVFKGCTPIRPTPQKVGIK